MTRKTQKVIIISSIVVLTGTGIGIAVNKSKKKKELAILKDILDKGIDKDGHQATGLVNATDPKYWQGLNKAGTIHMVASDATDAKNNATDIYNAINCSLGGWTTWNDNDAILAIFRRLRTKAYASMMYDAYATKYSADLKARIDSCVSEDVKAQIRDIIEKMPNY